MSGDLQQAKYPVSAVLAGPYGYPLHSILVTVAVADRAGSGGALAGQILRDDIENYTVTVR